MNELVHTPEGIREIAAGLSAAQLEALRRMADDPWAQIYRFDRDCWTTPNTALQKPIGILSRPIWSTKHAVVRALAHRDCIEYARGRYLDRPVYRMTEAGRAALAARENGPTDSQGKSQAARRPASDSRGEAPSPALEPRLERGRES